MARPSPGRRQLENERAFGLGRRIGQNHRRRAVARAKLGQGRRHGRGPPATLIARFGKAANGTAVTIAARIAIRSLRVAHTGRHLCRKLLRDAGAQAVIVGHSEAPPRSRRRRCAGNAPKCWRAHRAGLDGDSLCRGDAAKSAMPVRPGTSSAASLTDRCRKPNPDAAANIVVAY